MPVVEIAKFDQSINYNHNDRMDTSSGSNQVRLCKCPKCLRNSDDGILLKLVTYYRHAKYRKEETIARRTALFQQFGLEVPNVSSSSTGSSNRTRRRKKRANVRPISSTSVPDDRIFATCRQSTPPSHRLRLMLIRSWGNPQATLYVVKMISILRIQIWTKLWMKYTEIQFNKSCHAPQLPPLRITILGCQNPNLSPRMMASTCRMTRMRRWLLEMMKRATMTRTRT